MLSLYAMKTIFAGALFAFCLFGQQAQGPLTDQRICDLMAAGVSASEILRIIASAMSVDFDLRPGSTAAMMQAGVPEETIKAMAAREGGQALPASAPRATPPTVEPRQRLTTTVNRFESERKPRVFIKESNDSWSFTGTRHFSQGGTHPQTVEVMKTFGASCPNITVTNDAQRADYTVDFERESNKGARKHNKIAIFNRSGDMVYSSSTRNLGNAVRAFCASVR